MNIHFVPFTGEAITRGVSLYLGVKPPPSAITSLLQTVSLNTSLWEILTGGVLPRGMGSWMEK